MTPPAMQISPCRAEPDEMCYRVAGEVARDLIVAVALLDNSSAVTRRSVRGHGLQNQLDVIANKMLQCNAALSLGGRAPDYAILFRSEASYLRECLWLSYWGLLVISALFCIPMLPCLPVPPEAVCFLALSLFFQGVELGNLRYRDVVQIGELFAAKPEWDATYMGDQFTPK
jgi:hypothetical protein